MDIELDTSLQQLITTEQAWHYRIIPNLVDKDFISFYIDENCLNTEMETEVEVLFGKRIEFVKLSEEVISKTINKYYRKEENTYKQKTELSNIKTDDFLTRIISEAKAIRSSDIHIEVYEEKARIRYRIDGKLIERYIIGKNEYPSLINKIKITSNLDISEKRLPQDGRILFNIDEDKFDIRVSILPTLFGEKIVLRLLNKSNVHVNINDIGFSDNQLETYLESIKRTQGIVLISGPTGSGKTTTLYATLKILNKTSSNILTIEDPIEYTLEGVNQVQLKESIGLSFASALRTFLRQDPDIIMLGEIRDSETAQMAIRAALTGHLVLSTIHTNSAWGTISRLYDMGIPSYLLASTINLSIAQRLVRLLCPHCKKESSIKDVHYKNDLVIQNIKTHFIPQGCDHCYGTGYKGRTGVYEVIPIDNEIAEKIKLEDYNITTLLKEKGIKSIKDNAIDLVLAGKTSIDEIYPIIISNKD